MRSASRPCSPAHHHEGHAKLASSPPRASPVRVGPAYVLKKGAEGWRAAGGGRRGWEGSPAVAAGFQPSWPGWAATLNPPTPTPGT